MQKSVERLIKNLSRIKINLAEFQTKRDHEFTFEIGIYLIPTQNGYYIIVVHTLKCAVIFDLQNVVDHKKRYRKQDIWRHVHLSKFWYPNKISFQKLNKLLKSIAKLNYTFYVCIYPLFTKVFSFKLIPTIEEKDISV